MKAYIDSARPDKNPPKFEAPGNIVFVSVDKSTGAPSNGDDTITDASSPARSRKAPSA